jgi:hypothetical protein
LRLARRCQYHRERHPCIPHPRQVPDVVLATNSRCTQVHSRMCRPSDSLPGTVFFHLAEIDYQFCLDMWSLEDGDGLFDRIHLERQSSGSLNNEAHFQSRETIRRFQWTTSPWRKVSLRERELTIPAGDDFVTAHIVKDRICRFAMYLTQVFARLGEACAKIPSPETYNLSASLPRDLVFPERVIAEDGPSVTHMICHAITLSPRQTSCHCSPTSCYLADPESCDVITCRRPGDAAIASQQEFPENGPTQGPAVCSRNGDARHVSRKALVTVPDN